MYRPLVIILENHKNQSNALAETSNIKMLNVIPEPTARTVRRGLLIPLGYLHPGKCEHSEVQSHPPCHGRTTNDGFCRYAHARVITDFKNMADYMKSERWLKASEKAKTKTRTTATRLQEAPEKR